MAGDLTLKAVPLTCAQANELVLLWHRHHKPVIGYRFAIGVSDACGQLRGAAIVGRPVARAVPQYEVAEVTRLVTDGCPNACSFLYATCARITKEMGFTRVQTYILEGETGTTLRASGWRFVRLTCGGDWNTKARGGRRTDQPAEPKQLWEKVHWPQAT
jgi:hypothetical protein